MDSTSNIITRNETTQDNINPTMYYNTNSVHEFDSIIVTIYRNSFNIVDSLDILNQTTGQVIGSIKDNIGFKYIKIKAQEDLQAGYYNLFLQKDLITDNSVSYHVKLPANYPGPSGWYSYIHFAIGLDELDDITSTSSGNYNGHNMVFDF